MSSTVESQSLGADTAPPAVPEAAEPEPETAPEQEKKGNTPTAYHVLRQLTPGSPGEPQRWELHASFVVAQGAQAAIRSTVVASDNPQTFIAVPSRSFRPVTVTVETKTQLKLS